MSVSWLLALTLQAAAAAEPTPYDVRRAEHERVRDPIVWRRFLAAPDTQARRLAARAVGRLEDPALGALLVGALRDPVPAVRREAAWGIGQAKVPHDLVATYRRERDPAVRAAMLEALGRTGDTAGVARVLTVAVADPSETVAAGAARGLLALARRAPEGATIRLPAEATMAVGRRLDSARTASLRTLLLRTDVAKGWRGGVSGWTTPLRADANAEVRRLAVALEPVDVAWASSDRSPSVRYAALMTGASCQKATAALRDTAPLLRSSAAAMLGALPEPCDAARLDSLARGAAEWQVRGEALFALARRAPERAGPAIAQAMRSPVRQLRAWAARAARITGDSAALRTLARDPEPTVALEALVSHDDAIAALGRDHAGLVLAAATMLRGDRSLPGAVPALLAALERLSRRPDALTWRDPRVAILARLREVRDPALAARVARWANDADPAVALAAARITGGDTVAIARRPLPVPPFPDARTLDELRGAHALISLRGVGTLELELLPDDAPATVHTFAQLARTRAYEGTTFHRIVPNFVLQGGSPGADEYDPLTPFFMRDEVGGRHDRGTWGISTRGRDTGDGQLFVNLVDNPRLDHDYTVFARTVAGEALLDRVTEGTVIERVVIVPRPRR